MKRPIAENDAQYNLDIDFKVKPADGTKSDAIPSKPASNDVAAAVNRAPAAEVAQPPTQTRE